MNKRSLLVILSLVFSFSFSYNQKQISSYVDVMLSQILYDSISLKDLSIEEEKIKEKFTYHLENYFDGLPSYSLKNLTFELDERLIRVKIIYSYYLFTFSLKKVGRIDEKKS